MKSEMKAQGRIVLLAAALQVFGEKGCAASTIADVARRAGMGKGERLRLFQERECAVFRIVRVIF